MYGNDKYCKYGYLLLDWPYQLRDVDSFLFDLKTGSKRLQFPGERKDLIR